MWFRVEESLCSLKMAIISPWRKNLNNRITCGHTGDALLKDQKREKDAKQRPHALRAMVKRKRCSKEFIHINHKLSPKIINK